MANPDGSRESARLKRKLNDNKTDPITQASLRRLDLSPLQIAAQANAILDSPL